MLLPNERLQADLMFENTCSRQAQLHRDKKSLLLIVVHGDNSRSTTTSYF